MNADGVRHEIEFAFDKTPSPGQLQSDVSVMEADEGVADYFLGTTWKKHTVEQLRNHRCALFYFTDRAFRYWLPAFMLAVLEDPDTAELIAEFIDARFKLDASEAMIQTFTKSERLAVISFLEWGTECLLGFSAFESIAMIRKSLVD